MIKIYTDGSCLKNPGDGGWAAIIIRDDESKEISGNEKDTTNNRMELLAPINALKHMNPNEYYQKLITHNNMVSYKDYLI